MTLIVVCAKELEVGVFEVSPKLVVHHGTAQYRVQTISSRESLHKDLHCCLHCYHIGQSYCNPHVHFGHHLPHSHWHLLLPRLGLWFFLVNKKDLQPQLAQIIVLAQVSSLANHQQMVAHHTGYLPVA